MKLYKFENILNEIAAVFNMDQWDEQVNPFTDAINEQLNLFVYHTYYDQIYILENDFPHHFPQFNFYRKRCYVNGEKVVLESNGTIENKWFDKKTVNVTIEDLDQLGESCKGMFAWCESLVSVPWFNTSMVTNMRCMFEECSSLESVPKFNTNRVTGGNIWGMFFGCSSLSEKTIQDWSSVYDFKTNKMKRNIYR